MVVKNPADFIGPHLGQSEKKTKGILESTLGKVLVIDEVRVYLASLLSSSKSSRDGNSGIHAI